MKKMTISVLLAMSLCPAAVFTAMAADGGEYKAEDGTVYTYSTVSDKAYIEKIVPGDGVNELVIPDKLDGYTVKEVTSYPYEQLNEITSISYPDTVEKFSTNGLINLESVKLPSDLKELPEGAFFRMKSLSNITLPDGLKTIGSEAFRECTSLDRLDIPDSVNVIGDGAFYGCTSLADIEWDKDNVSLGESVFEGSKYLDEYKDDFILLKNDKELYAVSGRCKKAEIPSSVSFIWEFAFQNSNVEDVSIPSELKVISSNAFFGAKKLRRVNYEGSIDKIEDGAFQDCTALTEAPIPEGIAALPISCFSGCTSIKSVEIPSYIKEIGNYAFFENTSLTTVKLNDGLEKVGPDAFEKCSSLIEITIPKTVNLIEARAFNECKSLSSLTIEGAANIEDAAFCGTALKESNIKLADGVTYLPSAKYKDDALSFLYNGVSASEVPVYATKKPLEDEAVSEPAAESIKAETPSPIPTASPEPKQTDKEASSVIEVTKENDEIRISVGDEAVQFTDAKPFIDENNRTQMPVRALAEFMGYDVGYDNGLVTINTDEYEIYLVIGQDVITTKIGNGYTSRTMDTTAQIVNDRTYIPIRYIAEALGYEVEFVADNNEGEGSVESIDFDENGNIILPEGWLTEAEMQEKYGLEVVTETGRISDLEKK